MHQLLLAQAQEGQALKAQYPAKDQRPARHQAMQASRAKYQQQLQAVARPRPEPPAASHAPAAPAQGRARRQAEG
ncbi:MAG: hypothetical protein WKG07_39230 [Hymenobacter sp.]